MVDSQPSQVQLTDREAKFMRDLKKLAIITHCYSPIENHVYGITDALLHFFTNLFHTDDDEDTVLYPLSQDKLVPQEVIGKLSSLSKYLHVVPDGSFVMARILRNNDNQVTGVRREAPLLVEAKRLLLNLAPSLDSPLPGIQWEISAVLNLQLIFKRSIPQLLLQGFFAWHAYPYQKEYYIAFFVGVFLTVIKFNRPYPFPALPEDFTLAQACSDDEEGAEGVDIILKDSVSDSSAAFSKKRKRGSSEEELKTPSSERIAKELVPRESRPELVFYMRHIFDQQQEEKGENIRLSRATRHMFYLAYTKVKQFEPAMKMEKSAIMSFEDFPKDLIQESDEMKDDYDATMKEWYDMYTGEGKYKEPSHDLDTQKARNLPTPDRLVGRDYRESPPPGTPTRKTFALAEQPSPSPYKPSKKEMELPDIYRQYSTRLHTQAQALAGMASFSAEPGNSD